jgi:isopenicillin N synthase-like dioxygenase
MDSQPPILDVAGLVEGDADALRRVASALPAACERWGVFQIVNHGVPATELAELDAAMNAFFDRPLEEKHRVRRTRENAWGYYDEELTKNRPDWKEVFDYGAERAAADGAHSDGVNQWPNGRGTEDETFRRVLLRHHASCERVAHALLRALCLSLGLEPDALDGAFARNSSFVRLNRYAPCDEPAAPDAPLFPDRGHLGVHHHTDAGAFTLLLQDDVEGLQALVDQRWITIEPVAGALAVNLGDMLQVWSNDRYRSPLHRVIVHRDRARCSAPFFFNPGYDTVCAPLPGLLLQGEPPRFEPISWAHFRDQRSAGDFADYGAEIQIDDFRVRAASPA